MPTATYTSRSESSIMDLHLSMAGMARDAAENQEEKFHSLKTLAARSDAELIEQADGDPDIFSNLQALRKLALVSALQIDGTPESLEKLASLHSTAAQNADMTAVSTVEYFACIHDGNEPEAIHRAAFKAAADSIIRARAPSRDGRELNMSSKSSFRM